MVALSHAVGVGPANAEFADWEAEPGVNSNTVTLWTFDGVSGSAVIDQTLNSANDLALSTTGAVIVTTGKFNDAVDISYPDDHSNNGHGWFNEDQNVARGSTTPFPTQANPSFTVEMWVNFDTTDEHSYNGGTIDLDLTNQQGGDGIADSLQERHFLIDSMGSDFKGGYVFEYTNSRLDFQYGNGTSAGLVRWTNAPNEFTPGTWHHLAGTWDHATQTATIFLDGVVKLQTVETTFFAASDLDARDVRVGNLAVSGFVPFHGMLDSVRISDVAYDFSPVPEPSTYALAALSLFALRCVNRRRRQKKSPSDR